METTELSLRSIASPTGVLSLLALDHRDAMRNAFARAGVPDVSDETMLAVKERIVAALADGSSGVLLDPDAARRRPGSRPAGAGLLVPLEEQGHEPHAGGRVNTLLADFGAAQAAELRADGCKLLLYYRADHEATAAPQRELVARVAEECHRHGLPLVLEPLVYRLEGQSEDAYRAAFAGLVVAAARDLAGSGADLLKLQFPGDAQACARVAEAAAPLSWALLGGSDVDGETFAAQLETACRAGASGFMAGRVIWGGALGLPEPDQDAWLAREALPLFERLTRIAHEHARRIR
jgi:sulfofructosephosphate aldolase